MFVLVMFIAFTVVAALLNRTVGPQPSALGDFSVPTAQEGRAIPVVFGTCMIKGGNTVWWGDLRTKPVTVGGGLLGSFLPQAIGGLLFGKGQVTGYQYFLGCQFMLCHGPVDALIDIQADSKSVARTASTILNGNGTENYIQVNTNAPNLFGGTIPGGGGGISGTINFYRGLETQQPDAYLSAKQGRILLGTSLTGYSASGVGNGTITSLSGGSISVDETFTITCTGIDGNNTHGTYQKAEFSVVGSTSGPQDNITLNSDGSDACWADQAFSCGQINFTILTGSTQYAPGDKFVIQTQQSHLAPAYRGLCYAVFKQLYQGTSAYLKPIAFVVRRCPDPLAQGLSIANISGDANGALGIYDILTNPDYGLGLQGSTMNATSFSSAAVTLAAEGLGFSMQFDTQASADTLITEILRHIEGALYTDPATGQWTLALARGGYDPATLPVLTVDNVLATPELSRGSWEETSNKIAVRFTSRAINFQERVVSAYDPANVAATTEVRPQTVDYKGLSSEAAANIVAMRTLKVMAYPLAHIKIVTNRAAWQFRPCGLFRFTWTPLGIVNQVFRITRIGYGELTDGKITIDAVEDIFGINSVAFVAPPLSGWVNPVGALSPNLYEQIMEMPAHIQIVMGLSPIGIFGMAMAAQSGGTYARDFSIWRDDGSGYFDTGERGSFCPVGLLAGAYSAATVAIDPGGFTLALAGSSNLDFLATCSLAELYQGKNLCLVDGEIMGWQTVTLNLDGSYSFTGIMRGLMDTVPANHAPGAKIWFFTLGAGLINSAPFVADQTIKAKMLPENSSGALPLMSATEETVVTNSRAESPYPVGNLRMQGAPYGTRYTTIVGDLVLTFSYRDHVRHAGVTPLETQDAGDDPVTYGETPIFAWTVTNNGVGVLVGSGSTIPPSASFIYTAEARSTEPAGITKVLIYGGEVEIVLGGIGSVTELSLQAQEVDVIFTGFGLAFGEYFGGIQQ